MRGKFRIAVVATMVMATISLSLGAMMASAASSGGNILPSVGNSSPVTGGTLKIVGSGDVDHLDTCCAYYTTTYEIMRMVSRQLVTYRAGYTTADETQVVPDMATYKISPNGLTYTFTIKQ